MTNKEWTDLLSKEFRVSRTTAKNMLHVLMTIKKSINICNYCKYADMETYEFPCIDCKNNHNSYFKPREADDEDSN